MCAACYEGEKGVNHMPVYIVFRKYRIEADNVTQATKNCWTHWTQKGMRTTTSQTVSVRLMSNQATVN
jgi:hypothetical protein